MGAACHRQEAGFTLVEMLVALAIFAIVAAAGVGILRVSVDTQFAVERRLASLGQLSRLQTLLSSDLAQAVARATRSSSGHRPEFAGDAARMAFVRGGWMNPDRIARSSLQRLEWRVEDGQIVRIGHSVLDGDGEGQRAVLARGVERATFRYRRADGQWDAVYRSSPEQIFPAAVELTLARAGEAPLTFVMAITASGPIVPSPHSGAPTL